MTAPKVTGKDSDKNNRDLKPICASKGSLYAIIGVSC